MISKSKLIHGTIAATMALSMTILPIAPASAEETVSAPESDYTGWVTQDGEYYWFDSGIMARSKEIYDPGSDAWYWLDADGTMAHDKDVYLSSGNKWVRYDGGWPYGQRRRLPIRRLVLLRPNNRRNVQRHEIYPFQWRQMGIL